MLIFVISIIIGFVALFFGANWLVKGSSFVARIYGVRPMIIGLTVVAFGTSAPEFVVSVNAGILGQSSITVGNIIGSIIANSTLILGISALIKPLKIETKLFKKEMPLLILSQVLFIVFIWNGSVSRLEGAVLFLGFMLFVWYCIKQAMNVSSKEKQRLELEYNEHLSRGGKSVSINALLIIVGLIALVVGSHFVVYGAIGLANIFAIPAFMIAASVVAFGTSLPELAASTVAAWRNEHDISVGNVLGSNIFNIMLCIGIAAIIVPFSLESNAIKADILIMFVITLILSLFMLTKKTITRLEGVLLLVIYSGYIYYLFFLNDKNIFNF